MRPDRLAVAIPTCSDSPQDIRLGYVLQALALQRGSLPSDTTIVIRDEGQVACTEDPWVRLTLNMLSRCGVVVDYFRVDHAKRSGVGPAKADLLKKVIWQRGVVLCLDDDLIPAENALAHMMQAATEADDRFGFIQGGKVELDPTRTYFDDINSSTKIPRGDEPVLSPATFGDGAFLLINSRIAPLSLTDLDLIASVSVPGVAGEDVMLSALLMDHHPCYIANRAFGWHMARKSVRWRWEAPADLYNIERLLTRVQPNTLKTIFPHLANYITSRT